MAGIYLHIPFCKTKCHYCDFYKSTNLAAKHDFLLALKQEISMRKEELGDEAIHSIYFGGGTPSVLKISEINELIQFIYDCFFIVSDAVITSYSIHYTKLYECARLCPSERKWPD